MIIDKINIAIVRNNTVVISDVQTALDLMVTVQYQVDAKRITINTSLISVGFFDLKTRILLFFTSLITELSIQYIRTNVCDKLRNG